MDTPASAAAAVGDAPETVGEVTTLDEADFASLKRAMNSGVPSLNEAVLPWLKADFLAPFRARMASHVPFHRMLELYYALLRVTGDWLVPHVAGTLQFAELVSSARRTTLEDQLTLINCPIKSRDAAQVAHFQDWARALANTRPVLMGEWANTQGLTEILEELEDLIDASDAAKHSLEEGARASETLVLQHSAPQALFSPMHLSRLESFHSSLTGYCWLSYRFPIVFCDADAARTLRRRVEKCMSVLLSNLRMSRRRRGGGGSGDAPRETPASLLEQVLQLKQPTTSL